MQYYSEKFQTYYNNVREDLIALLPKDSTQRILEIGAGGGDTLVAIKDRGLAEEVIGVDLFHLPNTNQENKIIDNFIIADIEKENLPFEESYFDAIVCGDVLEHLVDPWQVIKKLGVYLKPEGKIIVSVPNIRNYKALSKIIFKGDFAYDPHGGILDKTHLRFFCKKNVSQLFDNALYNFEKVIPINDFPKYSFSKKLQLGNALTGKMFEEFFVSQYLGVATRKK